MMEKKDDKDKKTAVETTEQVQENGQARTQEKGQARTQENGRAQVQEKGQAQVQEKEETKTVVEPRETTKQGGGKTTVTQKTVTAPTADAQKIIDETINRIARQYQIDPKTGKYVGAYRDILGLDPDYYIRKQEADERLARYKRKESGWANAFRLISDMATAGAGGNVWVRPKDDIAEKERTKEQKAQENINAMQQAMVKAKEAREAQALKAQLDAKAQLLKQYSGETNITQTQNEPEITTTTGGGKVTTTEGGKVTTSSREVVEQDGRSTTKYKFGSYTRRAGYGRSTSQDDVVYLNGWTENGKVKIPVELTKNDKAAIANALESVIPRNDPNYYDYKNGVAVFNVKKAIDSGEFFNDPRILNWMISKIVTEYERDGKQISYAEAYQILTNVNPYILGADGLPLEPAMIDANKVLEGVILDGTRGKAKNALIPQVPGYDGGQGTPGVVDPRTGLPYPPSGAGANNASGASGASVQSPWAGQQTPNDTLPNAIPGLK